MLEVLADSTKMCSSKWPWRLVHAKQPLPIKIEVETLQQQLSVLLRMNNNKTQFQEVSSLATFYLMVLPLRKKRSVRA